MINWETVEIRKQGVEVWNQWREKHPKIATQLDDVDHQKKYSATHSFERSHVRAPHLKPKS
ncbi:MAG: hypothetical protein O7F12_05355 [Nitrospirae bacterium]|nr:hypothetical protein [Nitrospirota bacterium]